jgi:hypothetical protein
VIARWFVTRALHAVDLEHRLNELAGRKHAIFAVLPTKDAGHPVDSEQLQHYEIISYTEISEEAWKR